MLRTRTRRLHAVRPVRAVEFDLVAHFDAVIVPEFLTDGLFRNALH